MRELSHLGFAIAYRRIGIVVLKDGQLQHWEIAKAAYDDLDKLKSLIVSLIDAHQPAVIVVEKTGDQCRKGVETQRRIAAITNLAEQQGKLVMAVPRKHDFQNKYEEAEALAMRYPDLAPWVSEQVPCWENEPRRMILFEALAMTDGVMNGPTTDLAAAMG